MVQYYEYLIKAKNKMMKWISTIKEDLDAAGRKQADITDRKMFKHKVLIGKLIRRKNSRRLMRQSDGSLFRENGHKKLVQNYGCFK